MSSPETGGKGGAAPLTYGSYLKVPELLGLQRPLSSPAQHDEMLFIVIHQVYELWFRLMIHEIGAVRSSALAGKTRHCARLYRRLIEIQRVLLQHFSVLETMTPADFNRFREHLNPASGFQSYQFRELEWISGMKSQTGLDSLHISPEMRKSLEERLDEPDLGECYDMLLCKAGFDVPGGKGEETRAKRIEALEAIYSDADKHYDLYNLAEAMIEYDENFMLWRRHHILMVERMIGHKRGTGGTEGVGYLATTLGKRCFPELWEVRTLIGGDYGATPPPRG